MELDPSLPSNPMLCLSELAGIKGDVEGMVRTASEAEHAPPPRSIWSVAT